MSALSASEIRSPFNANNVINDHAHVNILGVARAPLRTFDERRRWGGIVDTTDGEAAIASPSF